MMLTLRHRALLEVMSWDNLAWDEEAQVYRNGTDRKVSYEAQLLDDLCAVGLAESFMPTTAGMAALKGKWPAYLAEIGL